MAAKLTLVTLALVAGLVCVQAAGGIKGRPQQPQQQQQAADEGQLQRVQGAIKGPAAIRPPVKAGPGPVAPVFTAARVQPAAPRPIVQQQQQQEPEPEIVQQQQQLPQQQEEIDPNAAAQDSAPSVVAPARAGEASEANGAAAASEEEANPKPEPYSFQYAFESGDQATSGSSTREEQQDASGRVTGFYTLKGEDGRDRRVDYVADASGFRATISTNELGTAAKDSADVDWNAQSPSDGQVRAAESATRAARERALANPQAAAGSAGSASTASFNKISSPRQKGAASSQQLSKANFNQQQQSNQNQQQQQQISQLQEPFEQIRQTELNTRARKSRHAPFYLFTV